jgi:hypothetical protein
MAPWLSTRSSSSLPSPTSDVGVFADGFWGFQAAAVRHFGVHRGIDALARRRAQVPAADIAASLRDGADHRLSPPVSGPVSGLADVLVHGGDIGRSWGKGAELHGPAAALMMAVCGRGALLDQLDGPGLSILRDRGIR